MKTKSIVLMLCIVAGGNAALPTQAATDPVVNSPIPSAKAVCQSEYWRSKKITVHTLSKWHDLRVSALAYSHDGALVASGELFRCAIKLLDVATRQEKAQLSDPDHHLLQGTVAVGFSPDDATIASGSTDKIIRWWDVKSGNLQGKIVLEGDIKALKLASRDALLIVLCRGSMVQLLNIDLKSKQVHEIGSIKVCGQIEAAQISPNKEIVAIMFTDRSLSLYSIDPQYTIASYLSSQTNLQFSYDSDKIATLSDNEIKLSYSTGEMIKKVPVETQRFAPLAFAHDDSLFAFIDGNLIKVMNLNGGSIIQTLPMKNTGIRFSPSLFSPDGKTFAAGDVFGNLHLWSLKE